jgi:hypothetical protein
VCACPHLTIANCNLNSYEAICSSRVYKFHSAVNWNEETIADYAVEYVLALNNSLEEGAAYLCSKLGTTVPCNMRRSNKGGDPQAFGGQPFPMIMTAKVTQVNTSLALICTQQFKEMTATEAGYVKHEIHLWCFA